MRNPSERHEPARETLKPTDYRDRSLTTNAQQYRVITVILAPTLPLLTRRVARIAAHDQPPLNVLASHLVSL